MVPRLLSIADYLFMLSPVLFNIGGGKEWFSDKQYLYLEVMML
jgi:hypothetical protein